MFVPFLPVFSLPLLAIGKPDNASDTKLRVSVDAHSLLQHAVRPHVNRTAVLLSLALTPLFRLHSDHHFGQLYHVALYDAAVALSTSRLHPNLACLSLMLLAHPHNIASTL